MKIHTITGRDIKRDLVDLFFLFKEFILSDSKAV